MPFARCLLMVLTVGMGWSSPASAASVQARTTLTVSESPGENELDLGLNYGWGGWAHETSRLHGAIDVLLKVPGALDWPDIICGKPYSGVIIDGRWQVDDAAGTYHLCDDQNRPYTAVITASGLNG